MAEITLALGGGGVKGIAHIGVFRVLEREKIRISAIAGTSIGGLVGAFIAAGYPSSVIEKVVYAMKSPTFFSRNPNDGPSILGLQGAIRVLEQHLGDLNFEDLQIPFACTAVDVNTSQEIILAHGNIIESVLATVAVPGIFPPRSLGGFYLVDGGVVDPIPVALARWLAPASPVVAVCLSPAPDQWAYLPDFSLSTAANPIPKPILEQFSRLRVGQALQIFLNSIDTTARVLSELRMEKEKPEVIIRPDVAKFGYLDHVDGKELIRAGEEAAEQALPAIRQALSWSNQLARYFQHPEIPGKILDRQGPAE